MLHNRVLTKENFETVFMCFAKNCINNGLKEPIDIYIVGGAAIVFNFDFRESTIDVDAMFKSDKTNLFDSDENKII